MREGADRALVIAFAASILLHIVMFRVLPIWRELGALVPPEPQPLIARVVRPALPAPQPAAEAARPAPPPPPKRAPAAEPAPEAVPAPQPEPEPESTATPQGSPVFVAQPAPEPAPAPVARIAPPVVAAAPTPTPPALDPRALAGYSSGLHDAAARFKRYPRVAIDNNWEGEVVVRMAIGADGRLVSLTVTRGSGHAVLDRQALQMFQNARPLVAIPPALRDKAFELELRAIYNLRDQPSG